MTPPREQYRVEWVEVLDHRGAIRDAPAERHRTFWSKEYAARQVAALAIEPGVRLRGVYECRGRDQDGLSWTQIDPRTLPMTPEAAARYVLLARARRGEA